MTEPKPNLTSHALKTTTYQLWLREEDFTHKSECFDLPQLKEKQHSGSQIYLG